MCISDNNFTKLTVSKSLMKCFRLNDNFISIENYYKIQQKKILANFTPFLEINLFLFQFSTFSIHLISKPNYWK